MKKKQFALIFMTLVIMLAVWYIKSPLGAAAKPNDDDNSAPVTTTKNSEFVALREAVRSERALEAASWDAILADENSTLASKQTAVKEKATLSDLTEREVLLEIQVINLGYEDAFVHYTSDGVEVYVLSTEESGARAVDIINTVYSEFEDAENVIVNFKTSEQTSS